MCDIRSEGLLREKWLVMALLKLRDSCSQDCRWHNCEHVIDWCVSEIRQQTTEERWGRALPGGNLWEIATAITIILIYQKDLISTRSIIVSSPSPLWPYLSGAGRCHLDLTSPFWAFLRALLRLYFFIKKTATNKHKICLFRPSSFEIRSGFKIAQVSERMMYAMFQFRSDSSQMHLYNTSTPSLLPLKCFYVVFFIIFFLLNVVWHTIRPMAQQRQLYVLQREFLKCGLMLCFDISALLHATPL